MFIVMPFNKFSLGLDAVLESTTLTNRKAKSKTQTHNDANPLEPLKVKKKNKQAKNKKSNPNKKNSNNQTKKARREEEQGIYFSQNKPHLH